MEHIHKKNINLHGSNRKVRTIVQSIQSGLVERGKRVPTKADDTHLITLYGINARKHIPFKQIIRTV